MNRYELTPEKNPRPSQEDSSSESDDDSDDDGEVDPMGYGVGDDVGSPEEPEEPASTSSHDVAMETPGSVNEYVLPEIGELPCDHVPVEDGELPCDHVPVEDGELPCDHVPDEDGELPCDDVPAPDTAVPEGTTEHEARGEGLDLVMESGEMKQDGVDGVELIPGAGEEYHPDNQLGLEDSPGPKPSAAPGVDPVHSCARPLRRAVPLPDVSVFIDSDDEPDVGDSYLTPKEHGSIFKPMVFFYSFYPSS